MASPTVPTIANPGTQQVAKPVVPSLSVLTTGITNLDKFQANLVATLNNNFKLGTSRINSYPVMPPSPLNDGQVLFWDNANQLYNWGSFLALTPTGVTAGTYGDATHVGKFTVNAYGQLTFAQSVAITGVPPGGTAGGDLFGTYPNPSVGSIEGTPFTLLSASAGEMLVGNGLSISSVLLSGDVSGVTGLGVLTLAGAAHAWASLSSFTAYTIPIGNGSSAPTLLAPGTSGYVLTSQGAGANPVWAVSSSLPSGSTAGQWLEWNGTSWVANTGPLGVAQGGTGAATLTANGLLVGAGTSAVGASAAPTLAGQYPYWNGSSWVMTPANSAEGASLDSFPPTASAWDDEFEASTVNSKWLLCGSNSSIQYGTGSVSDGTVVWTQVWPWTPFTDYSLNAYAYTNGNVYKASTGGVSYGGPTGSSGSAVSEPGSGTPVQWTYEATPTYIWQAGATYTKYACIILPQNGVMWANLSATSITAGTVQPAGLTGVVSTNPASPTTVSDNGGTWTQIFLWTPNTAYSSTTPSYVQSPASGFLYLCTTGGTSWNGPTTTSTSVAQNDFQSGGSGAEWKVPGSLSLSASWLTAWPGASTSVTQYQAMKIAGSPYVWVATTGGTTNATVQPSALTTTGLANGVVVPHSQQIPWNPGMPYKVGMSVVNQGYLYTCIQSGTSHVPSNQHDTVGPNTTVVGASITDGTVHWVYVQGAGLSQPPAWVTDTVYQVGSVVTNLGGVYICIAVVGTQASGATGPTGTTNGQTDNHSSGNGVTWNYVGPLPPSGVYSVTQRPGSLLMQGVASYAVQNIVGAPNTYFIWTKMGSSFRPGDTLTGDIGASINLWDNPVSQTTECTLEVTRQVAGGTFGTGITILFGINGPNNASIQELSGQGTYEYEYQLQALPSSTNGSATSNGFPLGMWSKTIEYIGILVQQCGTTGTNCSAWLAGADRVWFQPPTLYTAANWGNDAGAQGGGAWGGFYGAQFNYLAIGSWNVVPPHATTGGISAQTTYSQFEFVRALMNTSVLP